MEYSIERVKLGDEATLAFIQTESWKDGFKNILNPDTLQRCTQIDKVTAMYRRDLEQNIGNGYLLKVEGAPHCIACGMPHVKRICLVMPNLSAYTACKNIGEKVMEAK